MTLNWEIYQENSTFHNIFKNIEYIGVTQTKLARTCLMKILRHWRKTEEDIRRWILRISSINKLKVAILPKAIYRYNAIPNKFQHSFSQILKKSSASVKIKCHGSKTTETKIKVLNNEINDGGITILDFEEY